MSMVLKIIKNKFEYFDDTIAEMKVHSEVINKYLKGDQNHGDKGTRGSLPSETGTSSQISISMTAYQVTSIKHNQKKYEAFDDTNWDKGTQKYAVYTCRSIQYILES